MKSTIYSTLNFYKFLHYEQDLTFLTERDSVTDSSSDSSGEDSSYLYKI